jgi:hypothetical protein
LNKQSWKDTAELVGIVAILLSLIFVGVQLKQARVIAASEMNISLVEIGIESAKIINENVEIWVKGNSGGELDQHESTIFNNIVSSLDTRWFVEHRHSTRLGEIDQAETIMDDWSAFLHQHSGARASWLARQENLYRSRELLNPDGDKFNYWSDAIQSDLKKLDQAAQ